MAHRSSFSVPAALAFASVALLSTPARAENPIEFWNTQVLDATRLGLDATPTMSSYNSAIADVAIYNAVNAASGLRGQLYTGTPAPIAGADAGAAAYFAGLTTMTAMYGAGCAALNTAPAMPCGIFTAANAYANNAGYLSTTNTAILNGKALGEAAGAAMVTRWNDNNAILGTMTIDTGSTEVGKWRPTAPNYASGVTPDWGSAIPFVITSGANFVAAVPPVIPGSPEYKADLLQVQCIGGLTLNTTALCTGANALSQAQKDANTATALFWSNDQPGTYKPPGQWIEAAVLISKNANNFSLFDSARLLALVTTGMADAAIAQWKTKYLFDVWRPVTAVNDCSNTHDPNFTPAPMMTCTNYNVPDATTLPATYWWPAIDASHIDQNAFLHATPAFPAYASGHSTFGAVVATILTGFFGTDSYTFDVCSDTTTPNFPAPGATRDCRTYNSFLAASEENGLSRIYGGLHFSFDNTGAQAVGNAVGAYILANAFGVPEPMSLALLGLALLGLGAARMRRAA